MEGTTPAPVVTEQPAPHPGSPEHHIHRQPRDFAGRVNGAPRPGAPTPKPEAEEAPAEAPRFRVRYKANGQDVEEDLDHDTLAARLSREKASYSKFEEGARLRKEAEALHKDFEEGLLKPEAFRKKLEALHQKRGLDPKAAREQARETLAVALADLLDEEELSPEQKELRDLRAEREAREREEEEARTSEEVEAHKESVRAKAKVWANKIGGALKAAKDGGLPVTDSAIKAMSTHLSASMRHGVGCTEAELVEVYREDLTTNTSATLEAMDFADIRRLAPNLVKKIHAGLRAEMQQRKAPGARPAPTGPRTPPAEEGPVLVASDDFEAYQKAMAARRGR